MVRYLIHTLTWIWEGCPKISIIAKAHRLQQCIVCPHYASGLEACILCGCDLDRKTSRPKEKCPDKPPRWLAVPSVKL